MSLVQGTSTYILESTLQISNFVELLLEPINQSKHIYLIKLGLHEALVNAAKHGNNLDPTKIIKVRRYITPNWLVWQIQDQGSGLEITKRKFNLPSRNDSINGRGLFIIHECFDDVRWSPRGNRLQLALKKINFYEGKAYQH
tara:strand:+ start:9566 stop:9991 length:426 start_codon:yes stop_codon:yes gene_type:complete